MSFGLAAARRRSRRSRRSRREISLWGRIFSKAVYEHSDADGILYVSRLMRNVCCAVFDRVVGKLSPEPVEDLVSSTELVPALRNLEVVLVRS